MLSRNLRAQDNECIGLYNQIHNQHTVIGNICYMFMQGVLGSFDSEARDIYFTFLMQIQPLMTEVLKHNTVKTEYNSL